MKEQTIEALNKAIEALDYDKVSWVNKHLVIDLHEKATVLLESVKHFEDDELQKAINASQEFLEDTKDVITKLNGDV